MKILIVLAHPEPKSMNGALFTTAIETLQAAGHEVKTSNLYAMRFNPVSDSSNFTRLQNATFFKQQLEEMHATETGSFAYDVDQEQEKVEWCDLMIWQFPLWWFSVPGILKGWVDRVFAMGRFYGAGKYYEQGIFSGKKALLSLTTGGEEGAYLKDGFNGDIINMLKPIHRGIFGFTGWSVLHPHIVYGPARLSPEAREAELNKWKKRLLQAVDEQPIEVGTY
ncbi:flavodoxin family protein [Paraflavitalea soli]|uniref:Flavodoxin family protein n=1 Tax=Paraflavitalea soli TaxID=2315862 RepID=A0A3B7MKC4_9BACT|nr:NAD(P)H-dependent oxidoreductase [Paraflavitalea soli]AXY73560.1 flavodoxin family protein [Paraflavitalea soli]